jgi:hypothetical protein
MFLETGSYTSYSLLKAEATSLMAWKEYMLVHYEFKKLHA